MMRIKLNLVNSKQTEIPFVTQFDGWRMVDACLENKEIDKPEAKRAKSEISRMFGRDD